MNMQKDPVMIENQAGSFFVTVAGRNGKIINYPDNEAVIIQYICIKYT